MQAAENTIKKVQTISGTFYCREGDLITRQLEEYSGHTRNEVSMLGSIIRSGDNILDIGAHIGTFSIPFARFNKGEGKIFSFEAHPSNYKLLADNIEANRLSDVITPVNAVVSEKEGATQSACLPDDGNSGMYYFKPDGQNAEASTTALNIDSWLDRQADKCRFNLVKIDVEGAELSVLRSCRNILQDHRPALYIEINRTALRRFKTTCQDIDAILAPLGYHYFRNIGVRNSNHDEFRIAALKSIESGGGFFDLLAIHPTDIRYPRNVAGSFAVSVFRVKSLLTAIGKRIIKR